MTCFFVFSFFLLKKVFANFEYGMELDVILLFVSGVGGLSRAPFVVIASKESTQATFGSTLKNVMLLIYPQY